MFETMAKILWGVLGLFYVCKGSVRDNLADHILGLCIILAFIILVPRGYNSSSVYSDEVGPLLAGLGVVVVVLNTVTRKHHLNRRTTSSVLGFILILFGVAMMMLL
jgi:hypothetical protein